MNHSPGALGPSTQLNVFKEKVLRKPPRKGCFMLSKVTWLSIRQTLHQHIRSPWWVGSRDN